MVEFDESKQRVSELNKTIDEVVDALGVPALEARKKELEEIQNEEGFWSDQAKSQKVNKELKQVTDKLKKVEKLRASSDDISVMIELGEEAEGVTFLLPGIE